MAGFAQGSVELKHKTSGTNANIDHLRIYAKDDEYLFTVDNDGSERSLQYYHSTGISDSILHDLVDNGNGTANISGCNVRLYKTTDFTGDIYEYYVSGVTLSFIDGLEQYVVADYNNGNPILRVESNKNNVNESNVSCLFCCWRQGNEIHSAGTDSKALGLSNKISRSITDTIPYRKSVDGGLIISETNIPTPRTILITSAVVYSGVIPNNILSFNSWVDRMTLAYHSGGNWLYVDEDLYNNTQYDDGANLQTIPNNKFAVRWYYRSIGDIKQTFYVLGKNYYNSITDARNEYVRNDLPIVIRKHCVLVGRSIIEYNALNGITEYVQDISFASTTTPNHNDLNNIQGGSLGNYYHISASTFGYLSAVSADIQSQLNSKLSSAASPSLHNNLLGLQGGSSGNYYHISASTFGYLSAVSADIQSQLNSKISSAAAPSNHNNLIGLQGGSSGNYYHVSASTFGYLSAVSADIQSQLNSKISSSLYSILQEPTGFVNRTDTKLLFNDSTRQFTISALSGTFDIYYRGNKFTKSTDSITISNTSGLHFIYYSSAGVLSELVNTVWDIPTTIQVSVIYWTGTSSLGIGEERHGTVMDCATHQYLHSTFGTRYANGFTSTYTLNNDTSANFGISNGRIEDEDIIIDIINGASGTYLSQQINYPGYFPVYYRQGVDGLGTWRKDSATNFPYKNNTSGSRINYNILSGGIWTQAQAFNNEYVAYFIYATTEIYQPIVSVQGQRTDTTLIDAQNNNTPSNLNFNDFPIVESKLLYRLILKTNASYTGNSFRVQIADVTDYRNQLVSTGNTIGGTGTVTYVGLSANPIMTILGTPITNAGTFTIDYAQQSSGTVFAGPSAGSNSTPTFRKLTSADIPIHNQDFSTITNRTQNINAINERIETGFYQNSTPLTTSGWPVNGSWWHLLNLSHSNSANYYALQIAADYYSQDFRIRSTNNNGLQSWSTIYTSTNLPSVLSNYLPLSGGTLTGHLNAISISATSSLNCNSLILSNADISAYDIGNLSPTKRIYQDMGNSDYWSIYGEGSNNNGSMILEVGDDLLEYIKFRFKRTYSPFTTYTPYEFAYNTFTNTGTRVRIYYDDLIDSNTDYAKNCLEIATNTSNTSHSYKPGIGFHSRGQYASLLYLNGLRDWKAKDSDGEIITFYHTGNLPSVLGNYLKLSGGTMTGDISFTNLTTGIGKGLYGTNGDNDHWRIVGGSNGLNQGYLEIATDDDKSEPIYIKQYQGPFSSPVSTRTLTLLDSNGNTLIPQTLSSTNYYNAGSYYVSNYAAGGNPSLITNQGVATFYTLTLDYYNTGERSLKFADSAYLGPTFASFFNNGSTQNNAIVVKGVGNNDYGGIYFGVPGLNPRYIGTKGDNTLYIAGQYINSTGSFTQNGTSTFVGNTNIGREAWPELYSITIYDKLYVSGTSTFSTLYVNGNSTFNNDVTFNDITTFSVSSTFAALAKFNSGQVLEPIYVNSTSYTATDTSPGFLAFSNTSTTATRITLSDSTRNGKLIMIFNYSGDSRYIESNVTNGLNIAAGTTSTSKLMANGSLYLCIKLSSGTYSGGWKVREL